MIAENFRVVLTKYIRIAADVFTNRVFKGNTVKDRDSAPYRTSISTQFTVRGKPKSARVIAKILHHTFTVFVTQVMCCRLSGGRGDAVESPRATCKFFRIPKISFIDSVSISQNSASNSHCFGHTDSHAGSPWNLKRVYT